MQPCPVEGYRLMSDGKLVLFVIIEPRLVSNWQTSPICCVTAWQRLPFALCCHRSVTAVIIHADGFCRNLSSSVVRKIITQNKLQCVRWLQQPQLVLLCHSHHSSFTAAITHSEGSSAIISSVCCCLCCWIFPKKLPEKVKDYRGLVDNPYDNDVFMLSFVQPLINRDLIS